MYLTFWKLLKNSRKKGMVFKPCNSFRLPIRTRAGTNIMSFDNLNNIKYFVFIIY